MSEHYTTNWPERPTCHDGGHHVRQFNEHLVWREPEHDPSHDGEPQRSRPFRRCGYCGSIHPEDLLRALEVGANLHGSDWKYGWPHKFYVEGIPNPNEGREVVFSSRSWRDEEGNRRREVQTRPEGPTTSGKWYNAHLNDLDEATFELLSAKLLEAADIKFSRDDEGRLKYAAPYHGYQKTSFGAL